MSDQFVIDQLTWRSTWRRRMKQVGQQIKAFPFIWPCIKFVMSFFSTSPLEAIIILLSLSYLVALYFVFVIYAEPLGLYANFEVNNWYKRRSFGIWLAGSLAPLLALLGYFLSARRTQAMQAENQIKIEQKNQDGFTKALELIDKEGVSSIGSISIICSIGITSRFHKEAAISVLSNFLRSKFAIAPSSKRVTDPSLLLQGQAALNALCSLQNVEREGNSILKRLEPLTFQHIYLGQVVLDVETNFRNFLFVKCNFEYGTWTHVTFFNTGFVDCDLQYSSFWNCVFKGDPDGLACSLLRSNMEGCDLSGTDFLGAEGISSEQLISCKYNERMPPKGLPSCQSITLPPPWHEDIVNGISKRGRYLNITEAEAFWSQEGNDQYRPRDRDGNLIEIVYPNVKQD